MTTHQFLTILKRRAWWIAAGTLTAGIIAALLLLVWPKTYTSTSNLVVDFDAEEETTAPAGEGLQQRMPTVLELVRNSTEIHEDVAAATGSDTTRAQELSRRLSYSVPVDTTVVAVSAEGRSPQSAQQLNEAATKAVVDRINSDAPGMADLQAVVEQAPTMPRSASAPDPLIIVPAGLLIGLLGSVLASILLHVADRRLRRIDDIEAATGTEVLAAVGRPRTRTIADDQQRRFLPGSYPQLFSRLGLGSQHRACELIVVTGLSGARDNGRVAAGLVGTAAASGIDAVLIRDELAPTTASDYGIRIRHLVSPGPDAVRTTSQLGAVLSQCTGDSRLAVLQCGSTDSDPQLRAAFEVADRVVLVIDAQPDRGRLMAALHAAARAGTTVAGLVIVNGASPETAEPSPARRFPGTAFIGSQPTGGTLPRHVAASTAPVVGRAPVHVPTEGIAYPAFPAGAVNAYEHSPQYTERIHP